MTIATQTEFYDYTPAQHLDAIYDLAHRLYGDVVLAPRIDGEVCFKSERDSFAEAPVTQDDITDLADLDRLCVITDGFDRFSDDEADRDIEFISYVDTATGDVEHVQIAGDESRAENALKFLKGGLAEPTPGSQEWFDGLRTAVGSLLPSIRKRVQASDGHANDNKLPANAAAEPLPTINPADWQDRPIPERKWLVPGLIPSRVVTLLSGDGGTGKTLLALQIGIATALGCEAWAGIEPAVGRCLYIGAEDEPDEFHRRMAAILDGFGRSFSELTDFRLLSLADRDALLMVENRGKLVDTPLLKQVIEEVTSFPPSLIVLDTSVDFFGGDEIKRGQVKQFVGAFHRLAMELDCAVLLLSHPSVAGMQTGTGLSGSTGWNNAVRSRLYLTAADGKDADLDARTLTTMKSNLGPKGGKIGLRWDRGRFVLDDGTQINPARAILDKRADDIFLEVLSKLTRNGQSLSPNPSTLYAPTVIARHKDAKGVQKEALAGAMQRLLDGGKVQIVKEGPPSKSRSRIIVAAENFGPDRRASN